MGYQVLVGDCRATLRALADQSVHCVVTSPPYFGLRDYGVGGQIGLEPTPDEFVAALVPDRVEAVQRFFDRRCQANDNEPGARAGHEEQLELLQGATWSE